MSSETTAATTAAATGGDASIAEEAVLVKSVPMPEGHPICRGPTFDDGVDFDAMMKAYKFLGFQGTNVGLAIDEINRMLKWRMSDDPVKEKDTIKDPAERAATKCTIFLGYTSNMISSGVRETIRFIVQHKMVDCIVTTGGGIEEDIMKCLAPHYMGDFALRGKDLRVIGRNRIGNLLVPNENYCKFEDWFRPILNAMHDEQDKDGVVWSPSKLIRRIGKEINHPDSVLYWAYKNDIPIYCPAVTDGSIGDMIFFHSYKREGFVLDIAQDIRGINSKAMRAPKTGMLILGGGLVKHHICNANLMRNGADFSVFINTGQEFDGSDSGARPDEAISWGKIRLDAKPVKVYAEATIVFPLIASQSFAKEAERRGLIPKLVTKRADGAEAAGGGGGGAGDAAAAPSESA